MENSEFSQMVAMEASSKVKNGRVPTGIEEFDDFVEGGFPRGYMILLAGTAGAGKTIFASQYIYHGLSKLNESSVYVSFAENRVLKKFVGMEHVFEGKPRKSMQEKPPADRSKS